jgi:predicted dehydrogenase
MNKIKILVVGCGNMGSSHARAYQQLEDFEIVGLVSRTPGSRNKLADELGGLPTFADFESALKSTRPDAVSINTYPDTHAAYIRQSLVSGAHVFVEKPLALTVKEARELVALAKHHERKLVIGYILRVHPTWAKFVSVARTLGKPLVMRMNLNQQSSAEKWYTHKQLMHSMSPIVDCGVHYVDIMCLMTGAAPVSVSAIGARLTEEIDPEMYNYGQLQVRFTEGSVGWYEAGWGPMMSETAFFVKDVIGPKGCVSIVESSNVLSDNVEGHTKTNGLLLHHAQLDAEGKFTKQDELITTLEEPDHDGLCLLEQQFFCNAIQNNTDLTNHMNDAIHSLQIVIAADESFRTGKTIML